MGNHIDRIGVTSFGTLPDDEADLKKLLILYDHIWVPWLHESFPPEETIAEFDLDRQQIATFRWLTELEVLTPPEVDLASAEYDEVTSALYQVLDESEAVGAQAFDTAEEAAVAAGVATFNFDDAASRLTTYLALRDHDRFVYPVYRARDPEEGRVSRIESTQRVLSVVMRNLPMPSPAVSLQDLIDFRRNDETRDKFDELWKWIRKTASLEIPSAEIAEELAALQADYERHLKQLSKTIGRARLKTLLVMPATVAEDLVKFRWGKLAEGIFDVATARISAVERELSPPGSEIAFLLDARGALAPGR